MIKKVLIVAGIAIVGFAIYYGSFLFTKKMVNEDIPIELMKEMKAESSEPTVAKSGTFNEIDFIHKGKGRASLYKVSADKKLLRFEDFEVTNGPDLYVYLTRTENPKEDIAKDEFINLGKLKGTVGNQNYEINNLSEDYKTVVIWCKQFSVLFSFAVLE